ncbi:hypothetical protein D9613_009209 [Agrocybe pediades]|uniref:Mitochondrial carrier protein n=1 Tax=Agrocybe pediades TaxID=84607 RepID=A0A8H4VTM0_9AGAR|nr:hypothetical protein D9613_009209 [Agrocybe pediades]
MYNERRPLLADQQQQQQSSTELREEEEPQAVMTTKEDDLDWRWLTFYGVLTVLGIVGLSFLIKGFIESGDKDSRVTMTDYITNQPLRTVMNYQYRYGTTTTQAIRTLYADGGWSRYYQGLSAALVQGPVSRFGDTAANAGIYALLNSNPYMKNWPDHFKTIFASLAAAAFRMILTPIDTLKTTLQTQGKPGMQILKARIRRYGIGTLWYGALATAAATFVGHYPWFSTYNYLEGHLPEPHNTLQKLTRRAFIGFVASVASDTISNSLRVVKTYRQVNETRIGYLAAARSVVAVDGLRGLFGRGLKTRILANGLQGLMFTVLWRFFMDLWNDKTK